MLQQPNDQPENYLDSGNLATPRGSISTGSWLGNTSQQYFNLEPSSSSSVHSNHPLNTPQLTGGGDDGSVPDHIYGSEGPNSYDSSFQITPTSNDIIQPEAIWQPPDNNYAIFHSTFNSSSASLSSASYNSNISQSLGQYEASNQSYSQEDQNYSSMNVPNQGYGAGSSAGTEGIGLAEETEKNLGMGIGIGIQDINSNMSFDNLYNSLIPYLTPGGPPGLFDPSQQISLASHADQSDCYYYSQSQQLQPPPQLNLQPHLQNQTQAQIQSQPHSQSQFESSSESQIPFQSPYDQPTSYLHGSERYDTYTYNNHDDLQLQSQQNQYSQQDQNNSLQPSMNIPIKPPEQQFSARQEARYQYLNPSNIVDTQRDAVSNINPFQTYQQINQYQQFINRPLRNNDYLKVEMAQNDERLKNLNKEQLSSSRR